MLLWDAHGPVTEHEQPPRRLLHGVSRQRHALSCLGLLLFLLCVYGFMLRIGAKRCTLGQGDRTPRKLPRGIGSHELPNRKLPLLLPFVRFLHCGATVWGRLARLRPSHRLCPGPLLSFGFLLCVALSRRRLARAVNLHLLGLLHFHRCLRLRSVEITRGRFRPAAALLAALFNLCTVGGLGAGRARRQRQTALHDGGHHGIQPARVLRRLSPNGAGAQALDDGAHVHARLALRLPRRL
mmetsp:Transcript_30625/g.77305  ORF Transcript_30625/g.77305 Transcript_30625/m.77305 type:complete len:239 (+) Transcript_30625:13-729(+)